MLKEEDKVGVSRTEDHSREWGHLGCRVGPSGRVGESFTAERGEEDFSGSAWTLRTRHPSLSSTPSFFYPRPLVSPVLDSLHIWILSRLW